MEKENKHLTSNPSRDRILHFNSHNGQISIDPDEVLFVKADGAYSKIYMEDNKLIQSITHNLCYFERLLKSAGKFVRCHHCWLVNINKIYAYYEEGRLLIIKNYGIQVSVRNWREMIWIIADNKIKRIKELTTEIKILPLKDTTLEV